MTKKEHEAILKKTGRKDAFIINEEGLIQINNTYGKPCKFLNQDGFTCNIQEIKPTECKAYPLLIGRDSKTDNSYMTSHCPGKSFVDKNFIDEANKFLLKIPDNLRSKFYNHNNQVEVLMNNVENNKFK